ncbi:MAG TPA: MFS transporter [Candidatus Dormibacteraeota bacterium]|nr:MFS transporter [Candidatus Dormibacteraeota bacterium]
MIGARRWWALGGIQVAVLAVGLDITVLSVALPTLAGALRASEADLQWFSSGYTLVLAAAMLPAGLLGDRYGRRKVMLVALALFGVGSAACAAAPSPGVFLGARLVLGAAGAGIVVMAVSALAVLFNEEERPRAVAVWAAANMLAMPIGPVLGGWLLSHAWWGWVFLVNVPVALLALVVGLALVPESWAPERPGLDPVGVATSSAGLVGVTYGLIEAGQDGWGDAVALGAMAAGVVVLVGFLIWERRLSRAPGGQPLIDLALFRSTSFTWGVILVAVGTLTLTGMLFTMPQYFQGVLGTDAMGSGLRLLPLIAGFMAGLLPAAWLARLVGAKVPTALGFAVLAAAMAVGATTSVRSGDGFAVAWMVGAGVGMGLMFTTAASTAVAELSAERSGVGSAMLQALKNVGAPLGSALAGSVLSSVYRADLRLANLPPEVAGRAEGGIFPGLALASRVGSAGLAASVRAAFIHGMDAALLMSAGVAVVGAVLALVFLPARPARAAVTENVGERTSQHAKRRAVGDRAS